MLVMEAELVMRKRAIKQRLSDPTPICGALGLLENSRPQTSGLLIRCPSPLHEDREPSCSVRLFPDGQIRVHCFGCGLAGDVLTLVATVIGRSTAGAEFRDVLQAAEELAEHIPAAVVMPSVGGTEAADRGVERAAHQVVGQVLLELAPLDSQPDAAAYLAERGVLDEALLDGWGALPDDEETLANLLGWLEASCGSPALHASGLLNDGWWAFPDCRLLIPWRGPDGTVDVLQRRQVGDAGGAPRYVGPPGLSPHWPYGIHAALVTTSTADIVLVEGAIDVLAQRRSGRAQGLDRLVLGLPGVSNWRASWATLGAGRAVGIALDNDAAGHAAVPQVHTDLLAAGAREIVRLVPTRGKDWTEQREGCHANR